MQYTPQRRGITNTYSFYRGTRADYIHTMCALITLYAAFLMKCLAPGFQMAGTVSTHWMLLG